MSGTRDLWEISQEIKEDWKRPYFGAVPYIEAMNSLRGVNQMYGQDSGDTIVRYFLVNARTWRGETARRIKAELKQLLKEGS